MKQSSITDFQEIANDDISWGAGATSYGLIYANGNITWNNSGTTAYGSNYATGTVDPPGDLEPGATGFDGTAPRRSRTCSPRRARSRSRSTSTRS